MFSHRQSSQIDRDGRVCPIEHLKMPHGREWDIYKVTVIESLDVRLWEPRRHAALRCVVSGATRGLSAREVCLPTCSQPQPSARGQETPGALLRGLRV